MDATEALSIADLRRLAKRRLPRGVFDYIDRGAEDEVALAALRQGFESVRLRPRVLVDVSGRSLATEILGRAQQMPLVVAPTASAGLTWYDGEIVLAKAAHDAGIPFCVATESITAVERIAAAAQGPLWFQLYMWQDRSLSLALVDRARACGIDTLVLTADTVVAPNRDYNIRNGYGVPIRPSLRGGMDMLLHPRWVWQVVLRYARQGGLPRFQHYQPAQRTSIMGAKTAPATRLADTLGWDDFALLRRHWPGRLLLKGVLRADDARQAVDAGADGIVVSAHGGRNLDSAVTPIEVLPEIADAVAGRVQIIADSGVRRGSDVVKLLAAGAQAVMVGRAAVFGTAAGGQAGAARALAILRAEMLGCLGLLGCPDVTALNPDFLRLPA